MPESETYDKMIWSIVHKLLSNTSDRYYYEGLENDLFQEGYLGLLDAKRKYNSSNNTKLSTFAYKYIYGYCLNFLKKEFSLMQEIELNEEIFESQSYEMEPFQINLIEEIEIELKKTNRKLQAQEKSILEDRLCKELSLQKCAELNNCSIKKVTNTINKYKDLIKFILIDKN